jgi:hypothetical protein
MLLVNNGTSETLNVSFLIYDPGCSASGQPWRKEAWWVIPAGQTILPNIFDLDLTSVNGWVGAYAFTASRDKDWQGTGNAWFKVSNGVHFDQCGENEANCPNWVDFEGMYLGKPNMIAYFGPNRNEIAGPIAPTISLTLGDGDFYVSGRGFVPGSNVELTWDFDSGEEFTQGTATLPVSSSGTVATIVTSNVLIFEGTLTALAKDTVFSEFQASASTSD